MNVAQIKTVRIISSIATLLAVSACSVQKDQAELVGNAARGKIALTQYACHACHVIPGITGSKVFVGPSLDGVGSRPIIAGHLPNNKQNLMAWIRHTQSIDPQSAMPDMGVTEEHARDMAAYLSSLK